MNMKKIFLILIMFFHNFSIAEDTPSTYQTPPAWLSQTRKAIKSKDFDFAEKLLIENIDQNQTAEWNNLMGYSLRKKNVPNLADSEKFYQSALEIDPKHKDALEYYGELLLMKNDLQGAETLLKRLDAVCTLGCEQYRDLKKSITNYKSKRNP